MPDITGIAHIQLSVSDMAVSYPFYKRLLTELGMTPVIDDMTYFYCVGGKTAVAITPVTDEYRNSTFEQGSVGLHHVCFRARSREDVEYYHNVARELGATIIRAPEDGEYAPGYYSILFEDPDGIRIEINHVPGKGLLNDNSA